MKKNVIVDYGMGNLFSVKSAVKSVGEEAVLAETPSQILAADRVILPGVGAFQKAIDGLKQNGLFDALLEFASKERPLMGICLGMQLLFSKSYEFGEHTGLDLLHGKVIQLTESENVKIPHIGWNSINQPKSEPSDPWKNTILQGLTSGSDFYFVHSYVCVPEDRDVAIAETSYGTDLFCAVARKNQISGCQFHPEKSGRFGLMIYKNFLTN